MKRWRKYVKHFSIADNTSGLKERPSAVCYLLSGVFFKKNLLVLSLFLLIGMLPTRISKGCGPGDFRFHGYSFLNPGIINAKAAYAPFFLDFKEIYQYYKANASIQQNDNLLEWQEIFCDLVEVEDLKYIIYKASVSEMKLLQTSVKSKAIPLDYRITENTFARHLKRHKCLETVNYLIFAKQCEPHVTQSDPWKPAPRNTNAMQKLIDEGRRIFRTTQSHYIRLRYAYQLIRLAHYKKDYRQTLALHDFLIPKFDRQNSIIHYWIEGHRAGALMALGEKVEASHVFAKIFQDCPSKRESAYRSFKISTDEEWKQCLLLCNDDSERATLYAIRANARYSRAVEEMGKIHELDPKNENLELLLVKEIRELERDLLGYEFNDKKDFNKRNFNRPRKEAGRYVIELQDFVRKVAEAGMVVRPELWMLAEGYLELLAGDHYAAAKTFEQIRPAIKNKTLKEQLEVFELALKISSLQTITPENEQEIYEIQDENEFYKLYPDFEDFIKDKFSQVYQWDKSPGKAFRCHNSLTELKPNPKIEIIDDLLGLCKKEDKNRFEKNLVEDDKGNSLENDLLDIKATFLMTQRQLEAALEVLKEIDRAEWDNYGLFDPFEERLNDCVFCPRRDTSELLNKGEILEELLDLEYRAKAELDNSARYYYRIGLALYNMTYFGYAWNVMDYYRSGGSYQPWNINDADHVFSHWSYPLGNRENMDCSQAMYYFEKTRLLTKDRELGAKAAFMAAKCEQKQYFTSKLYQPPDCKNCIPEPTPEYQHYFYLLQENYSDTPFFLRIINECMYFEAYVTK